MIVELGQKAGSPEIYAWIERARGWTLDTSDRSPAWREFDGATEVAGIGGSVLNASQVAALVAMYGKPAELPLTGGDSQAYNNNHKAPGDRRGGSTS